MKLATEFDSGEPFFVVVSLVNGEIKKYRHKFKRFKRAERLKEARKGTP